MSVIIDPMSRELERAYKPFEKHQPVLYNQIVKTYLTFKRILNSTRVDEFGSHIFKTLDFRDPDVVHEVSKYNKYMAVEPDYVETRVKCDSFQVRWNPETAAILSAYFGPLDGAMKPVFIPDDRLENQELPVLPTEPIEKLYTMRKMGRIHPAYNFPSHWEDDIYPGVLPAYKKQFGGFGNLVYFIITLDTKRLYEVNNTADGPVYNIIVHVEALIRWPWELALYVTCTANQKDFVPYLFKFYVEEHKKFYQRATRVPLSRISNLAEIKKAIVKEVAKKPRLDADNLLIYAMAEKARCGSIAWIPQVDNVDSFMAELHAKYSPERSEFDGSLRINSLLNTPVLTDWVNEKFTFINGEGHLETRNLMGAIALDDMTILRYMQESVFGDIQEDVFEVMDLMTAYVNLTDKSMKTWGHEFFGENAYVPMSLQTGLTQFSKHLDETFRLSHLTSYDISQVEEDISPDQKALMAFGRMVSAIARVMLNDYDNIMTAYSKKFEKLRFYLVMFSKHLERYAALEFAKFRNVATNTLQGINLNSTTSLRIIGCPGITHLMPHQVRALNALAPRLDDNGHKMAPAGVCEAIHVGGGKTLILAQDGLRLRYEGLISTPPAFVMPQRLCRSWYNEITNYSKGGINPVILTLKTIRRMKAVFGGTYNYNDPIPDYPFLHDYIKQLPVNSVLIISYSFLSRYRKFTVYGEDLSVRYLNAEFLRDDIGIEFLGIDESQGVKNLLSDQTEAVSVVASGAKYKRLASGTMVNNTPIDIVGQTAMINPSVFGSDRDFKNRYLSDMSSLSSPIHPHLMGTLVDIQKPYLMRINVHKREWAHLLPVLRQDFHQVVLTNKQQTFYNKYQKEMFEELFSNPRIAKLMDETGSVESDKIEKELNVAFQKLELFCSAPDQNALFVAQDNLEPIDLVSPKVAAIIKLCRKHMGQFFTPEHLAARRAFVSKQRSIGTVLPMGGKLAIFSYRVSTPQHIYDNLPPDLKKHAVLYTVKIGYEALERFMNDDNMRILIASESTINKGFNFQYISRIIRVETLLTPGDQDQAKGRIERPDVRNEYGRTEVFLDWLYTNHTVEVTKIARLISKIIQKAKYDEADNPLFHVLRDDLDDLPLIKLNLKNIALYSDRDEFAVEGYFQMYKRLLAWEQQMIENNRTRVQSNFALMPENHVEFVGKAVASYIPRVDGVEPWSSFKLAPISVLERQTEQPSYDEEDSEEEEESIQVNKVKIDQLVDTEFGLGRVKRLGTINIHIAVFGILKPIILPKTVVNVFKDKQQEREALSTRPVKAITAEYKRVITMTTLRINGRFALATNTNINEHIGKLNSYRTMQYRSVKVRSHLHLMALMLKARAHLSEAYYAYLVEHMRHTYRGAPAPVKLLFNDAFFFVVENNTLFVCMNEKIAELTKQLSVPIKTVHFKFLSLMFMEYEIRLLKRTIIIENESNLQTRIWKLMTKYPLRLAELRHAVRVRT